MAYADTKDPRIKVLGEIYHARFSCKGQRVQTSLHTKNYKIAVQLVDDIEKSILLGEDWQREKGLFEEMWPRFLEDKVKGKVRGVKKVKEKTLKQYIHFGERYYLPFFGSMRVDKMFGHYEEYLEFAKGKSKAGADTKMLNHWKYLSGFATWAHAIGEIKAMPSIYNTDRHSEDEDDEGPGRNLTDEQLKWLRDGRKDVPGLPDVDGPEMPMKLWIYAAQFMGMRSFEISQLLKSRIDLERRLINLGRAAKGARPRKVPIHREVLPLLIEQMNAHPKSPCLFPNAIDDKRPMDIAGFKKPWTRLRESLDIECVFKDFRSSHATRAGERPGANPVQVCGYMGMSLKVFMKHYYKPSDDQILAALEGFEL